MNKYKVMNRMERREDKKFKGRCYETKRKKLMKKMKIQREKKE